MIRQVVFVLAVAACQPMYGNKPERLRPVEPIKQKTAKPEAKPEAPPAPVFVDKCKLAVAMTGQSDRVGAKVPYNEGVARLDESEKQPADSQAQAATAKQSLEKFRDALTFDNFHADATLGLARAYYTFHRKGCALEMLKRIGLMRQNPALQKDANRVASSVMQHADQWFAPYQSEARDAVTP
jgi:hypothetical protein